MATARSTAALVLAATFLAAGCGDDSGGAGSGAGGGDLADALPAEAADDAGGTAEPFDIDRLCSLLEPAEIEAEFGERGRVADGIPDFVHCQFDIGEDVAGITLSYHEPVPGRTGRDEFAGMREVVEQDPEAELVEAPGVGDEAYFEVLDDQTILRFRSGEINLAIGAYFVPPLDGVQERLVTLARHALDRL